jgi:hypothetical protein
MKLAKTRRVFNRLATFLGYDNGNIVCHILFKKDLRAIFFQKPITIPIYYTKFIVESFDKILKFYRKLYF